MPSDGPFHRDAAPTLARRRGEHGQTLAFLQYDVFTREPLLGNQLAVFLDQGTGTAQAQPQRLPLEIRRHVRVVDLSGSQATVQETSTERALATASRARSSWKRRRSATP